MKPLSHFLDKIPAVNALNISVITTSDSVTLCLPYDGNTNHHATVFGGSLALGATLAGWAVVHEHFGHADGNIVIKKSNIRYLAPATTDVFITATIEDDVTQTHDTLTRFGKTSVNVTCELMADGMVVGRFGGVYVVKATPHLSP